MPTAAIVAVALAFGPQDQGEAPRRRDWRDDWAVEEGFALQKDAEGFQLPSAIAVIPRPGPGPDAPLYFVTELGGTVKVVTRDRRVHVFAGNLFQRVVREEIPSEQGESGLAGICLAPSKGYVFVTFAHRDSAGTLRNTIVRFETEPERFGVRPRTQRIIAPMLGQFRSAPSHQIGPCQVDGDLLYVSVGDGAQTSESRNVAAPLGKILRMTLDGRAAPGNPFRAPGNPDSPQNYTWALGFRNPFSLNVVRGRVFVADNGPSVDRFLEAQASGDYLWDGTDWSIGMNAAAVMTPSPSPVQMVYVPASDKALPEQYRDRFIMAMAGLGLTVGPANRRGAKGVVMLRYGFATRRVEEVPRTILRYRGDGRQYVVGLGLSAEGLYVVPLLPDTSGSSAILLLRYAPDQAHPHLVLETRRGFDLITERGCLGCHAYGDRRLGTVGPMLDRDSLLARLGKRIDDPAYERALATLDQRTDEPAVHRAARAAVLTARGPERLRLWVRYKIQAPRFENPDATMPDLRLSAGEAASIAEFLVDGPPSVAQSPFSGLRQQLSWRRVILLMIGFAAGSVAGTGATVVVMRRRRRRSMPA